MTEYIEKFYDFVVVGGGLSGVCAAIAAARHGAKTALIQNRPVFGGNASSEIRMHVCGAAGVLCKRPNARETGIIEELLLENKSRNPFHSFSIFDTVLWEKVHFQENLDSFLNTQVLSSTLIGDRIQAVEAYQNTTEKYYRFIGKLFADTTGDAYLARISGSEVMIGREGKDEYNEPNAPEHSYTMGNSLMFKAVNRNQPVSFTPPSWAKHFTEEDLEEREHSNPYSGYWWVELGGDMDVISDYEEIRDDLLSSIYGIWDHVKNGGDHGAENLDLDWVQFLPGKRESYRAVGKYVLTEQDICEPVQFDDVVAYGGWPIDLHTPSGIRKTVHAPNVFIDLKSVYGIPYRSLQSRDIQNLFLGGRAISATHNAFASLRCMGTTSVIGQAIGTAASVIVNRNGDTTDIGNCIILLQQILLEDDCYLPGIKNISENDLCRTASFRASSEKVGTHVSDLNNGFSRPVDDNYNGWTSGFEASPWIEAKFQRKENVSKVIVKFDSNLNEDLMITLEQELIDSRPKCLPATLVKRYTVQFISDDRIVHTEVVDNNHLRSSFVAMSTPVSCDSIRLVFNETYGADEVTVFEVRAFS